MSVTDELLVKLLAGHSADYLRAEEGIRTVGRALLARRVLALEPTAVKLEVIPEEFEEGARAGSAAAYDGNGTLLRSFEGDSEDPADESITGLLPAVTPEAGTEEWFGFVTELDPWFVDLAAAANTEDIELAAAA